jgi:pilus assembly protein CpaB
MKRRIVLLAVAMVIAALGAAMVLLYANGQSAKAVADQHLVKVLTATGEINTGESATQAQSEGKFALTEVPKSTVVVGAVTSIDTMGDQVALAPIYPGEQILAVKFGTTAASTQTLPVPKGKVAISVQLDDPGRVAGFLTPGSHVAIFVTIKDSTTGLVTVTRILVSSVEVIGVGPTTILTGTPDSSTPAATATGAVPQTVLTVALPQHDADRVIFASNADVVSFGLLGRGTTPKADPGVHQQDLLK